MFFFKNAEILFSPHIEAQRHLAMQNGLMFDGNN